MNSDHIDLDLALRLHFPIVVIESHDEEHVVRLLKKAISEKPSLGELQTWSAAFGLSSSKSGSSRNLSIEGYQSKSDKEQSDTSDPEKLLRYIKNYVKGSVILLPDFHPYLTNPIIVRLIKEIAQQHYLNDNVIVLLSHSIDLPSELERLCAHVELSLPDMDTIMQMITDEANTWQKKEKQKLKFDRDAIQKLAQNLKGLTHGDVTRLVRNAIYADGAITHCDIDKVMTAKYKLLSSDGALSFEFDLSSLDDIGGFSNLKQWLKVREPFFVKASCEKEIDIPKGMLLVGVQGCGKSLAAKAVAGTWGVPLLRLDVGGLYNKYLGESERSMRDALAHAEALSPCVLWVDEIEKAIQSGNDDTGTSNRMLGTLLTWMAENRARVFVVATSNDIQKLPPELMRKGRLDEIFFVDLPDADTRKTILSLHIKKRDFELDGFDIETLAAASAGFSGAEIEQGIISARYAANANKVALTTAQIMDEFSNTKPLSVVRGEDIAQLRAWAQDRTVFVD